ncbi:hypothetical protein GCM10007304_43330 [Rhodococcoides trifolii]|uniref:EfeO-type cupredoxin-like domain-containing protein n=1 Tax=Rhodococcoides trifolii TaxID=908250 RepID=A0A917G676_9NOCA|nr:hypothetical protein [Rhodococcus trifolii]GGG24788.1 hypothetical protein GCM10007304_43330 [Rhodococcus trifolii]
MRRAVLVGATAVALIVAGCSQSEPETQLPPPGTSVAGASVAESSAAPTPTTSLGVTIAGGEVTPVDQRVEGKVGQEIVVTVNSDAADEIHVHSVPEHSFPVEVGDGQEFRFTVDVPGSVDVELHEADVTVATILVRP